MKDEKSKSSNILRIFKLRPGGLRPPDPFFFFTFLLPGLRSYRLTLWNNLKIL